MEHYLCAVAVIISIIRTDGQHFDLSHRKLQRVPSNILSTTESLDLGWNRLKLISNDTFINLSSLASLDLSHNQLYCLEPGAFNGLSNLTFLSLNHNNLQLTYEAYPPDVFRPLNHLETLMMIYNANTDKKDLPNGYPDQLFGGLGFVTRLAIDGIDGLPFGPGLLHMHRLKSLHVNLLSTMGAVPEKTLAVFVNLSIETLYVECSDLEARSLKHFPRVKNLRIKTDGLNRALSALVDIRHRNLTSLSLSNCNLNLRNRLIWANLILSKNNTAHLANICVKNLDLSHNFIIRLGFQVALNMRYPDCLQSLDVGENSLAVSSHSFALFVLVRFKNLRYINTSPGRMFYMPFNNAYNPGIVDSLRYTVSSPPSLQLLNVSFVGTVITRLQHLTILNAENLRIIDLAFTRVVDCWLVGTGFQGVEVLNISGIDCSMMNTHFFKSFPGLRVLVAQNCNFRQGFMRDHQGQAFSSLKYLKKLDLSNNDLTNFHKDVFKQLVNLETLILRNNKLTVMPVALFNLQWLRYIDLSFNVLSSLAAEDIHWLTSASRSAKNTPLTMSLSDNSLLCTCNTLTFVHFVLDNFQNIIENYSLACSMDNGTVIKMSSLKSKVKDMDVRCVSKFWLTFSVFGSCLLTLVIILAIFGYRYRWNIKYWIRTKCRRGPVYDELAMEHYQYDAFVAYNSQNYRWACTVLRNVLETQNNYTLCLHDRDFPVGVSIQQNIVDAVNNSRKVILVITRAFLRSDWSEFEIQMAGMRMVRDGRENAIIVIMMEEIPVGEMPRSLLNLWKHITFLLWENEQTDEEIFWERLLEVMARP